MKRIITTAFATMIAFYGYSQQSSDFISSQVGVPATGGIDGIPWQSAGHLDGYGTVVPNAPVSTWNLGYAKFGAGARGFVIASPYDLDGWYLRKQDDSGWQPWRRIITENMLGSNAYNSTAYLSLVGGSLTGALTGTSATFNVDNLSALGGQVTIKNGHGNQNGEVRLNLTNAGATSWIKGLVTGPNTNGGSAILFGVPSSNADGIERMRITSNGDVAIGTTDPQGYKLAIAGNVIAESVKVALQGTWPDYVFKPNHKLLSLSEVEKYVQENSHLPEIPSDAEVKKDGIDLGQMDAKLLKKIEELTLYMIEQNKESAELRKTLEAQNKLVQQQNKRIVNLEKQLKK